MENSSLSCFGQTSSSKTGSRALVPDACAVVQPSAALSQGVVPAAAAMACGCAVRMGSYEVLKQQLPIVPVLGNSPGPTEGSVMHRKPPLMLPSCRHLSGSSPINLLKEYDATTQKDTELHGSQAKGAP